MPDPFAARPSTQSPLPATVKYLGGLPVGKAGTVALVDLVGPDLVISSKNQYLSGAWQQSIPLSAVRSVNLGSSANSSVMAVAAFGLAGALLKKNELYLAIEYDAGGMAATLVVNASRQALDAVHRAILEAKSEPAS